MKLPVIFLAFANDQDKHLALLEEERKAITGHLIHLANEQYFQLFSESSATIADLSRYAAEFKDRVAIFHYGGHAGSSKIFLRDQAANADGLAYLLSLQPNLQLVFLNGCSTRAQVDLLLSLGIPAVVATSVPIEDNAARDFADVFYKSLATRHSIEEAFKNASANYRLKSGQGAEIFRGLDLTPGDEDTLPWGLYAKKGKEESLDWKLPMQSASSFIVRGAGLHYQAGVTMNQKLIETIANAIAPYSEAIADMVESAKRKGREPKLRDLRAAVIDSFPTPIGTHLRKLLLSEEVNTDRLSKIVQVYNVAAEMLAFILLAQLWDEKYNSPKLNISDESFNVIKGFLELTPEDYASFSAISLIRSLADVLDANGITPFVTELSDLRKAYYADDVFQRACLFLEEMKRELAGTIGADEIESFCVQAEDHLCAVFSKIGFSAKYTLATIKTIELLKKRHEPPNYRHNLVVLDKITAAFGVLDDILISSQFSENESVILLHDEEEISPFLNLSPFIIDENALAGQQNSKIFFYRYAAKEGYNFLLIDNLKDTLVINDNTYPVIKKQMDTFRRLLLSSGD